MARMSWGERIAVLIVVAVGVAARCYQLGYNFDGDEVFSAELAAASSVHVLDVSLWDRPHPPLHNFLLHLWMLAFGPAEVAARSMSVSLSAVFLVAGYALYRRVMPVWAAVGATAVLAVSPYFVYYTQQNRPYAVIAAAATLNLLAFVRFLDAPAGPGRAGAWAAASVVLLYSQYMGGLLVVLETAFALVVLKHHRPKVVACAAAAFALVGLWVAAAVARPVAGTDPLPHIAWMSRPVPSDLAWFYVFPFGVDPVVPATAVLGVLAAAGVWFAAKAVRLRSLDPRAAFLVLVAVGFPAVVFAVSILGPKPVFERRQMLSAAVAFVGVLGLFAAALPRVLDAAFLATILAWAMAVLPQAAPEAVKPPWRQVAADLDAAHGSTPVVVPEPWVSIPLRYYRGADRVRLWEELSDAEKAGRFFLVCRPRRETVPGLDPARLHRPPLTTWRWGRGATPDVHQQLHFFVVSPR